jgi:hypothetical protein
MSNIVSIPNQMTDAAVEHVLLRGDLARLDEKQRLNYYMTVCQTVGLNHLTRPFEYITLNNRLTLYARKDATDQLRKLHKVSIRITDSKLLNDIYIVSVSASDSTGREDASTGAVNIAGLKGDALANAFLKCETKAKRRVTLSICGLGMLDETEVETISSDVKAQAIRDVMRTEPEQISGAVDSNFSEYMVGFGKFSGQRLKDIGPQELESYMEYLEGESAKRRKPLEGRGLELVQAIQGYLNEIAEMPIESNIQTKAPATRPKDWFFRVKS